MRWRMLLKKVFGWRVVVFSTISGSWIPRFVRSCENGPYIVYLGNPQFLLDNGKIDGSFYICQWKEA